MATLKELRKRLMSTNDTKKITTAMTLVAAAKFRRSQKSFKNSNSYAKGLLSIFQQFFIYAKSEAISLPGFDLKKTKKKIYIVLSGDKGLCGSFNNQLGKAAATLARKDIQGGIEPYFICFGNKGFSFLQKIFPQNILMAENNNPKNLTLYLDKLLDLITKSGAMHSYIVYNKFTSPIKQTPICEPLFELDKSNSSSSPLFGAEPLSKTYIHQLMKDVLQSRLYSKLLESNVGEEGSRMFSMDNATRNADKLIDRLTVQCNRTRQAIITTELTEIISGAEALE